MTFIDKVVLVTGASSGIGAAIAIKFAEEGAKIALVGRNQDKLKNVAAKCGQSLVIAADLTKDEDCKRIINETIAYFRKLDVLVNNAGVVGMVPITAENAMQVFDHVMTTNLRAVVYLTHLASSYLIETKGNVINISSAAVIRSVIKNMFAYNTSKAGLDHFTRSAALDLASSGVRVNSINPGPVRTDIILNTGASETENNDFWDNMKNSSPLKRVSEPEEVADLALFLASDKAKAVTGASYITDNGVLLAVSV